LFSYENAKSNRILLIGKGSGGVQELLESLKDDIIGFALVRKTEKIDESITGTVSLISVQLHFNLCLILII
jgi:hypothetical protein